MPPSKPIKMTPLPADHYEVAKMPTIVDAAQQIIHDRIASAGLHFNSEASSEAVQAVVSQSHLPVHQQAHRKAHLEFTDERKVKFLTFLAKFGLRMRAAQYAGVSYATACNHKNADKDFAAAWNEAAELFTEGLENEALKRAIDGWDEPVYQKGELVGTIHRYSERMMEILLKANLPQKYRENIKLDANVTGGVLVVQKPISADEWEQQYGSAPAVPKTIDSDGKEVM